MNYRHHYHAGNFADVMKHALLLQLIRALQKKEKGFLYLDTHAGRGGYDLNVAGTGDTLARKPEWPDGIGRLWGRGDLPVLVQEYIEVVRNYDRYCGNLAASVRFYPGSPWFARRLMRPQDRLALGEKQPDEFTALRTEFGGEARVAVQEMDGYAMVRATLPPSERRALILIDPPFEVQDEFVHIVNALAEGLRRMAAGVFAVWYPLTERARVDEFLGAVRALRPPATLMVELAIAGVDARIKMKGCGLLVINPPWQFDGSAKTIVDFLAEALVQARGASGCVEWIVPK